MTTKTNPLPIGSILDLFKLTPETIELVDRKTQGWAKYAYRAIRRILMMSIIVVVVAYLLNILIGHIWGNGHYLNLIPFFLIVYVTAMTALQPKYWLRVFGVGLVVGIPDPAINAWQGGEKFLSTYTGAVISYLSMIGSIVLLLSLVSFSEYPMVPLIGLAASIVLTLLSKRLGWSPTLALTLLFFLFLVLGFAPSAMMALSKTKEVVGLSKAVKWEVLVDTDLKPDGSFLAKDEKGLYRATIYGLVKNYHPDNNDHSAYLRTTGTALKERSKPKWERTLAPTYLGDLVPDSTKPHHMAFIQIGKNKKDNTKIFFQCQTITFSVKSSGDFDFLLSKNSTEESLRESKGTYQVILEKTENEPTEEKLHKYRNGICSEVPS